MARCIDIYKAVKALKKGEATPAQQKHLAVVLALLQGGFSPTVVEEVYACLVANQIVEHGE